MINLMESTALETKRLLNKMLWTSLTGLICLVVAMVTSWASQVSAQTRDTATRVERLEKVVAVQQQINENLKTLIEADREYYRELRQRGAAR